MGVDAEMIVKIHGEFTQDDIRQHSYIFGQAFKHALLLGHADKFYNHPLMVISPEDTYFGHYREPLHHEEGKTRIKVPLCGRYYGEEYERGPLFVYIGMAELLEHLFPACQIYYFGDSGGCESAQLFDRARRTELIRHYVDSRGTEQYNHYFTGEHGKHECPHCKVGMTQNGFSSEGGYYTCLGCGWHMSERFGAAGYDVKFV